MLKSGSFWRPVLPAMANYGMAILSVACALLIAHWMQATFESASQASLLLCAVVATAWLGGFGPGLIAVILSVLSFDYFFLYPTFSLAFEGNELPRLMIFGFSVLFVGALSVAQRTTSESLKHARDVLHRTVQELLHTNDALKAENAERKRVEQQLQQSAELLEQRVMERTHELSTLLETSNTIAATLELQPLLQVVLDQLQSVVPYTGATVLSLEDENLVALGSRGSLMIEQGMNLRLPAAHVAAYQAVLDGGPVIIDDLQSDHPQAQSFREAMQAVPGIAFTDIRSLLVVPLIVRERMIGIVWIDSDQPQAYNAHDAQFALVFANQAAAAIENARLYDQARDLATLEERQRLARELHDAVTQTLFSASLIAEALPDAWQQSPAKAQRGVEELRLLTRGALAEMRALLIELRPSALAEKPLAELLRQLCASVTSRTRIPIRLEVVGNALLGPTVQIALYRITQEVLNNIAKHAGANQVTIAGSYNNTELNIRITDDGCGFDPAIRAPGSFGLDIMRERAASINAAIEIASAVGTGTEIRIDWQAESVASIQGKVV